jgi:hypothetical protein
VENNVATSQPVEPERGKTVDQGVDDCKKGHNGNNMPSGRDVGEVGRDRDCGQEQLACGILGAGAPRNDADQSDVACTSKVGSASSLGSDKGRCLLLLT